MPSSRHLSGGLCKQRFGRWFAHLLAALRQGLSERGYLEGQNLRIEYRWADGYYDRLPSMAADLVRRRVGLIISTGGIVAARAVSSRA
jgi:putative ABC transport system substrate-binding protein